MNPKQKQQKQIPTPGIEPGPRRWKRRILTTRPRGICTGVVRVLVTAYSSGLVLISHWPVRNFAESANWFFTKVICCPYYQRCKILYDISKLVRALWLVNLAGRTLLHGPLKFKAILLPKYCVIYHQMFSKYEANNSLKLSFTLNWALKRANDLKKRFQIDSFCFRPVSKIWSRSSWIEIATEPVRHTIEI